jgi:hypothetical protein
MPRVKNYAPDAPAGLKIRRNLVHWAGTLAHAVVAPVHEILYPREVFAPGVSAEVITRNDPWFFESLASVQPFVDEFVIVDSSNLANRARNQETIARLGLTNVVYRAQEIDSFNARRLAHSLATRQWALHWDGDMIASDDGPSTFAHLMDRVHSLPVRRQYYVVFFPLVNVGMSLEEVPANQIYQVEAWLYSNSRKFDWSLQRLLTRDPGRVERPQVPLFYRKLYLNQPYALHLARFVPRGKWISKRLAHLWMTPEIRAQYPSYEAFYRAHAGDVTFRREDEPALPYDERIYGPLPKLVKSFRGKTADEIFPDFVAES